MFGRHSVNARLVHWADRLDRQSRELQKNPHAVFVMFTAKETLAEYTEFLGWLRERLMKGDMQEFSALRPLLSSVGIAAQKLEMELESLTDPDLTQFVEMTDWEHTRIIPRTA